MGTDSRRRRRWTLLWSIQTARDVALITLYDQQGVKSFSGTVGAFINCGKRRHFASRERARIVVDSFIKACFLEHPRSLSLSVSHLVAVATRVIFIHTYVASYARRRFLTHVSHPRQAPWQVVVSVVHWSSSRSREYFRRLCNASRRAISVGCWAWTIKEEWSSTSGRSALRLG